jgi:hypothetical protein
MTSQVFTIHGTTNNSAVFDGASSTIAQISSALYLTSDLWSGFIHGTVPDSNSIRIPKGCDLKLWESTIYGIPATVAVMASSDSGATYSTVTAAMNSVSGGQYTVKHNGRPIVISSPDGKRLVKFVYNTKDSVNNVYADFAVEIVESNTY